MDILVTGGAGFIGSHLCAYLYGQGHRVMCVDDLSTGRLSNIEGLLDGPDFSFKRHDVCLPLTAEDLPWGRLDRIYNLACPASPPAYQSNPVKTFRTSVWGIWHLLELARSTDARLLQASTSEVYGDPLEHPQRESYWGHVNPTGIRACYDEGKRAAETLMMDHHRMSGTDIRIVRIFNTYGPHMTPGEGRVVSNFIKQALGNEDMTIYGNGDQTRSFCHVNDIIRGLHQMMENNDFQGPVNLGNPSEFTIKELAELIRKMVGSSSRLVHKALPADDPRQRRPDISLAREKLNWAPVIPLEEGLHYTIEWYRNIAT